jgi:hypothetical protein
MSHLQLMFSETNKTIDLQRTLKMLQYYTKTTMCTGWFDETCWNVVLVPNEVDTV